MAPRSTDGTKVALDGGGVIPGEAWWRPEDRTGAGRKAGAHHDLPARRYRRRRRRRVVSECIAGADERAWTCMIPP